MGIECTIGLLAPPGSELLDWLLNSNVTSQATAHRLRVPFTEANDFPSLKDVVWTRIKRCFMNGGSGAQLTGVLASADVLSKQSDPPVSAFHCNVLS